MFWPLYDLSAIRLGWEAARLGKIVSEEAPS
jgi:hypothetical protein